MINIESLVNVQLHLFEKVVKLISKADLEHLKVEIEGNEKYKEQLEIINKILLEIKGKGLKD